MNEFLKTLKAGDKVVWCRHMYGDEVVVVKSVTKTGRINIEKHNGVGVPYVVTFNSKGNATGDFGGFLAEYTPAEAEKFEKRDLVRKLENVRFGDLTIDQLRKISEIVS